MRCRVVERADGTVIVINPAPKCRRPDETEEQWYTRVFDKAMITNNVVGRPFVEVEQSEVQALPRARRHAWRLRGGRPVNAPEIPDIVPVPTPEEKIAALEARIAALERRP